MGSLNIVNHSVFDNVNRHLVNTILPEIAEGKKIDFLLPSERQIFKLKQALLSGKYPVKPGQLYFGSYFAWAKKILDAQKQYFKTIGAGDEWLILFEFLKHNPQLFKNMKPGSLSLIRDVVTEIRESGLTGEQMRQIQQKCSELAPFMDCLFRFTDIVQDNRLASSSTILWLASEYLSKNRFITNSDHLVVAGFYEFNPIQRKNLNNLIRCYKSTTLFYPLKEGHPSLHYLKPVSEIVDTDVYKITTISDSNDSVLSQIAGKIFQTDNVIDPGKLVIEPLPFTNDWSSNAVTILRCPTRRQEVASAARTIKKWINNGINVKNIAVVYQGNYDYLPYIRLIFPAAGILIDKNNQLLSQTTPLQIIRKVIDVNERNFDRDSIIDLIRFQSVREYYGREIIQKFEYKSVGWGLSYGKDSWIIHLSQRKEFLRTIIDEDGDTFIYQRELEEINQILPVLQQFIDDISLPLKANWSEYVKLLKHLLKTYWNPDDSNSINQAIIEEINAVFRSIKSIVNPHENIELRHFAMAFNNLISDKKIPVSEVQSTSGLTISTLLDVRSEHFDAVVLLGMSDGEFPVNRRENPLLNSEKRKRINKITGQDLFKLSKNNIVEDKFLFYNFLNRIGSQLLMTFPQFDSSGRNIPESPFLDDFFQLMNQPETGQKIQYQAISPAEIIPDIAQSISTDDLLLNHFHYQWENFDQKYPSSENPNIQLDEIEQRIANELTRKDRIKSSWNGNLSSEKYRQWCFKKPMSVTRLQQYAWCPFLYLCQYIWKIDTVEEPSAEISALSDGLMIHTLFESFLKMASPASFADWKTFITKDLDSEISNVLDIVKSKYRSAFAFIDDAIWEKKIHDLRTGMRLFVEREIEALESRCKPDEFEKRLNIEFPVMIDNAPVTVPFQVKIDRVDRTEDDRVILLEYKRSRNSVQDPLKGVDEGIYFQLPFYMLAYKQLLEKTRFAGVYSYVFNEGKIAKGVFAESLYKRQKSIGDSGIEELLEKTRFNIEELLNRIYKGDFFLNPHDIKKRCQHGECPYYEICRIDTRNIEMDSEPDE